MINGKFIVNSPDDRLRQFNRMPIPNTRMQSQTHTLYLQLDEAARVVAVGLEGLLLVEGVQEGVGLIVEGLGVEAAEVEAQVVQQELHGDL